MAVSGKIMYLIVAVFLFYGASVFTLKRFGQRSLTDRLIGIFIVATSQQVLTGWILGMMGFLSAEPLFIFNLVVSILLIILSKPKIDDLAEPFQMLWRFITSTVRFCRRPEFLIFLILDVILIALVLVRGVIYPPYSWDGVHYHFGQVGFMIQDSGMGFLNTYPMESYPRNIELTYLWNTIFHRHQIYMNCLQALYILPAMFACYGIARKAGGKRNISALAAMAFPAIPIVFLQASTGYIDIAVSALLLCAINFLIARKPNVADMILAGLSFGLLIGAKGSGVVWMFAVLIAWIILYGPGVFRDRRIKGLLILLVILIAAAMPNGIYMYVRNWIVFSNPVHPYNVSIGDNVIFEGTRDVSYLHGAGLLGDFHKILMSKSWLQRMYFTWADPVKVIDYDGRRGGFGPIFFLLLLPAYAASILIALLQRNWKFLRVMILLTVPLIALHQLSWWSRYSIFFIAAGITGFAYIHRVVSYGGMRKLLPGLLLLLSISSCFLYFQDRHPGPNGFKHYINYGPAYWHSSQFSVGGVRQKLYRRVYPYLKPGTTIMVDTSLTEYWENATGGEFMCFWNLNFSNRVEFAGTKDPEEWFAILLDSRADYVLTDRNGTARKLIAKNPKMFKPIARDNEFVFYQLDWSRMNPVTPP